MDVRLSMSMKKSGENMPFAPDFCLDEIKSVKNNL